MGRVNERRMAYIDAEQKWPLDNQLANPWSSLVGSRRWRLVSAQNSIKFGYCPSCTVSIVLTFMNTTAYHWADTFPISCCAPRLILFANLHIQWISGPTTTCNNCLTQLQTYHRGLKYDRVKRYCKRYCMIFGHLKMRYSRLFLWKNNAVITQWQKLWLKQFITIYREWWLSWWRKAITINKELIWYAFI